MNGTLTAIVIVLGIAAEGLVLGYATEFLLRLLGVHERKAGERP